MKYLAFILLSCLSANAGTYYIDYAGGSDLNSGVDQTHPWQRAPGMPGFNHTYAHAAGDRFIFKGGVTWPVTWSGLWTISAGGSSGALDYYGVDQTWFSGPSWTRPIFDNQGVTFNGAVWMFDIWLLSGVSYITIDGLDFRRFYWDANTRGGQIGYIGLQGYPNSYITITNCWFHDWRHAGNAPAGFASITSLNTDAGNPGNQIINCVFDGENSANSTDFQATGSTTGLWDGSIIGCTIKNLCNGGGFGTPQSQWAVFAGNNVGPIWNSYNSGEHDNGIHMARGGGPWKIYGNKFHDTSSAMMFWGDSGETVYFWNNVCWNPRQSAVFQVDVPVSGGKTFIWNNTVIANGQTIFGVGKGNETAFTYDTISAINNHLIQAGTFLTIASPGPTVAHQTNQNTVSMSSSTATSQGYTLANLYAPTSTNNSTFGAGVSLIGALPAPYNLTNDILGTIRPQSSRFDAGAYEFVISGQTNTPPPSQPPATPTNLGPPNGANSQPLRPTLVASAYSDPQGSAQTGSEFQVSQGGNLVVDASPGAVTSYTLASSLSYGTGYTFQVRHQNALGLWSGWSTPTTFTTLAAQAPNTPSNLLPLNGATNTSLTPTLSASSYSDPQASPQLASQWQIFQPNGTTLVYDSGAVASFLVPVGVLQYASTYRWQVRYENSLGLWSSYSPQTSFTTTNAPAGPPPSTNSVTIIITNATVTISGQFKVQ